jgi:hypothetical protein
LAAVQAKNDSTAGGRYSKSDLTIFWESIVGSRLMLIRIHGILFLFLLLLSNHSNAALLPKVDELERLLGESPVEIEVVEPHLAEGKNQPHAVYIGYPVEKVFPAIFGNQWKTAAAHIEFRALDGYVSRIPTERFDQYHAYLVFAKRDSREFKVNNLMQHERDVALAPYYLVWDNIHHPDLINEGGTYWPYQVNEILMSKITEQSLATAEKSRDALELEKYCLSCHQVNGLGGNKSPFDLAEQTKILGEEKFLAWVLKPTSIRPDTKMPAINEAMPEAERRALALRLFAYLKELPHR